MKNNFVEEIVASYLGADQILVTPAVATNVVAAFRDAGNQPGNLFLEATSNVIVTAENDVDVYFGREFGLYSTHSNGDQLLLAVTYSNNATVIRSSNENGIVFGSDVTFDANVGITRSVVMGSNLYVRGDVFGQNMNIFRNQPDAPEKKRVGYAFRVNQNEQLELLKYAAFVNDIEIFKRVAVFGGPPSTLDSNDANDAADYLAFDGLGQVDFDRVMAGSDAFGTNTNFTNLHATNLSADFVTSSIIPKVDAVYDLGASNLRFRDLFLTGNTIHLGDVRISSDPNVGISLTSVVNDSSNGLGHGNNGRRIRLIVDELQVGTGTFSSVIGSTSSNEVFNVQQAFIGHLTSSSVTSCNLIADAARLKIVTSERIVNDTIISACNVDTSNLSTNDLIIGNRIRFTSQSTTSNQLYILPASIPSISDTLVLASDSQGVMNWSRFRNIGDISAFQITDDYLEMNGQIVQQATYSNLFAIIGHQPEFRIRCSDFGPGLYPLGNIRNSFFNYGKNNVARNGNVIMAVGDLGLVYISTNDGESWSMVSTPFSSPTWNVIAYCAGTWNRWVIGGTSSFQGDSTNNGVTWSARTAGSYNRADFVFNTIDSTGIFVGGGGNIHRSTNASTWSQITWVNTSGTTGTATLRCVAFALIDGTTRTWVVGGGTGTILFSTNNGVSFTQVSGISTAIQFNKVAWVGPPVNSFVMGGDTSQVWTSIDGQVWVQRSVGSPGNIQDISVSPTNQHLVMATNNGTLRTSNLVNWGFTTAGNGFNAVDFVTSQNEFVAVGEARLTLINTSTFGTAPTANISISRNRIARSCIASASGSNVNIFTDFGGVMRYNASTSTATRVVEPGFNMIDSAFGNGVWVVISKETASAAYVSSDLINWSFQPMGGLNTFTYACRRVRFLNGNFIVLATTNRIYTSVNGTTWVERTTPSTTKNDVVWTGLNYVVACTAGSLLRSSDLANWTTVTLSNGSRDTDEIVHVTAGIVIAIHRTGWVSRSIDHGVNWTSFTIADAAFYNFCSIATDNVNTVVIVSREACVIATSMDQGLTWSVNKEQTATLTTMLNGVVFGNGRYIVYGRSGLIGVSTNGLNWQWSSDGGHFEIIDMAFGNGFFVGAGYLNATIQPNPIVVWSPDGINWTKRVVPHTMIDNALTPKQRVAFGNDAFVIAPNANLRAGCVWTVTFPYNTATEFQIPTMYLGTGSSKLWIKAR